MRKAVIDVGSNSVLLLVAESVSSGWMPIHEATAVTALGEGTKSTGVLSPPAIDRTLDALARFFSEARALGAEPVAAATMAARIATNTADFIRRAEAQGTPVSVLSGEDEARLGFESVATDPQFTRFSQLAIVDPGGHSTEIAIGTKSEEGWRRTFLHSYPIGTLGLLSSILTETIPPPSQVLDATVAIDEAFAETPLEILNGPVVVLGATGTNLVSIREALPTWQPDTVHGAFLLYEEIGRSVGWLMAMSLEERARLVGMERGRERTLPSGALILERALFALRAEGCYVSVRGWRHALLEQSLSS